MTTLIISDLHLDPLRPVVTELFLRFLREQVSGADALYILGDLFEVWIGDDMPSEVADMVAAALRTHADAGTPLYFMPGNRDFLVGADYAARAGFGFFRIHVSLISMGNPRCCYTVTCYVQTISRIKRSAQTRDPEFIAQFLTQTLSARLAFAQQSASGQSRAPVWIETGK